MIRIKKLLPFRQVLFLFFPSNGLHGFFLINDVLFSWAKGCTSSHSISPKGMLWVVPQMKSQLHTVPVDNHTISIYIYIGSTQMFYVMQVTKPVTGLMLVNNRYPVLCLFRHLVMSSRKMKISLTRVLCQHS